MVAPWTFSFPQCARFTGEINNQIYQEVRWVRLEDLPGYEFPVADRGLVKDLAEGKLL